MIPPLGAQPRIVHETARRVRFRWRRLLDPALDPGWLEAWLGNVPGVGKVRVNPQGCSMVAEHDGDPATRARLLDHVARIPLQAFARRTPAEPRRRGVDALAHVGMAGLLPFLPVPAQAVVAGAMGAPAVLRGLDTLVNEGLKVRVLDMATVGVSLLRGKFLTAASISAMIVVGEYLRQATEDRSNALLQTLVAAPVGQVWVERDGVEVGVGFHEVEPGDIVLCATGEAVAVDGRVESGEALVDVSSITGESRPVRLLPGDEVVSGSMVVDGRLRILAERTGDETNMARIAAYMTRALGEQSRAERRSDRLSDRLAPITLGLGGVLYAATGDAERALSVLTVDYACAVKFPAPVVVKTTMYAAAREGIVIKSGSGLDGLADADAVVLDKTGTLTRGELSVAGVVCGPGPEAGSEAAENEILRLAASVEDRYGHPLGRAIVREAEARKLAPYPVTNTDYTVANGVSGRVSGELVRVGGLHFIGGRCGVDCSAIRDSAELLSESAASDMSMIYVALGDRLLGAIVLRDTVRPEAGEVLDRLRASGVRRMVLLTGDQERSVRNLAQRFPQLDEIHAECAPEDKAEVVRSLRDEGYTVAMVGDGVNDAPAFVAANVGVCMSRSTGLARDSAQVVLGRDSLDGLYTARALGQRAGRILQHCFNAGVGVNSGLLLAASAGLLQPAVAAAIHNTNTFAILGAAGWSASRALNET